MQENCGKHWFKTAANQPRVVRMALYFILGHGFWHSPKRDAYISSSSVHIIIHKNQSVMKSIATFMTIELRYYINVLAKHLRICLYLVCGFIIRWCVSESMNCIWVQYGPFYKWLFSQIRSFVSESSMIFVRWCKTGFMSADCDIGREYSDCATGWKMSKQSHFLRVEFEC